MHAEWCHGKNMIYCIYVLLCSFQKQKFNNDYEIARAYTSLLKSKSIRSHNSCLLYSTRRHHMIQKRQSDGSLVKIYIHQLAVLHQLKLLSIPHQKVVSHLCGHPNCVRASHLNLESQSMNLSRVACHNQVKCKTHGVKPLCIF